MAKRNPQKRLQRCESYAEEVRRQFASAVDRILALKRTVPGLATGVMYSFDGDTRSVRDEVAGILRGLHASAVTAIKGGIEVEWEQANLEVDALITSALGRRVMREKPLAAWFDRGEKAMRAFRDRTDEGFNLSGRIWRETRNLRDEMEVAMTVAIGEGTSASAMSARVRKYLNDPELMFRRFRYKDESGEWRRKWKKRVLTDDGRYKFVDYDKDSYKVGSGMYKSSYKNAMRLARTETNMAYRRADHERWQKLDFVLGQHIEPSASHPREDICDELAGDYPKDFVFEGWHPNCFCICTPILATEEQMMADMEAALSGDKDHEPDYEQITEYPEGFSGFVRENEEYIREALRKGTAPYFIEDNLKLVKAFLRGSR